MDIVGKCFGECSQSTYRIIKNEIWELTPKRYTIEKKYRLRVRPIMKINKVKNE